MQLTILKAIRKMLEDDTPAIEVYMAKVSCAVDLLDELIKNYDNNPQPQLTKTVKQESEEEPFVKLTPQPAKRKPNDNEVIIVTKVNSQGATEITEVKNAGADTKIQLDGKVYSPAECIGKTFNQGKIL